MPAVLLVEDEPMLQDEVTSTLEDAGFAVLALSKGEDALEALEREQALRALLTDIDLGGPVKGWEIARRAREKDPHIPVVYMTGGHADEWAANGVPNSVLITKPFAPAQIITAISQLLNETPRQD